MPISLACPGCKAKLKAPDAAAGHKLACPGCKQPLRVPVPSAGKRAREDVPTIMPVDPPPAIKKIVPITKTPLPKQETEPPARPEPKPATKPVLRPPEKPIARDEDDFQDFEVIGDDIDALDEVLAVEDLPEVQAVEDVLEEVDEELDELEEVGEGEALRTSGADLGWSKLLRLPLLHVKGHTGSLVDTITKMDNAGYDLIDPGTGRALGVAVEVRDTTAALVRHVAGRSLMETRVEIREGRDEELLCTIRRPPYLWGSTLEILDADEEVIGTFERSPWSQLTARTVWVTNKAGKKLVQLQPKFLSGRCHFLTVDGREVGEMMTEAAYERKLKIQWCPRGGSYYVTFKRSLDGKPFERLLYLAAALGLDLFATEQMTGH